MTVTDLTRLLLDAEDAARRFRRARRALARWDWAAWHAGSLPLWCRPLATPVYHGHKRAWMRWRTKGDALKRALADLRAAGLAETADLIRKKVAG